MELSHKDIINHIKNNQTRSFYFLHGEEPYYLEFIEKEFVDKLLNESEKEFDFEVFYGKDCELNTVLNSAKQFPLIGSKRLVILKEAQHIKKWDELALYLENPVKSTVLLIVYKDGKLHQATVNKLAKIYPEGVFYLSKKLYDNQIPAWIEDISKEYNCKIEPTAAVLFADYLGNDLNKIANELNKLCINLKPGSLITSEVIEKNIGISKEYSVFEFTSAVARREIDKANKIAFYFGNNSKNHPLAFTLIQLYKLFSNLLVLHLHKGDKSSRGIAAVLKLNPFFTKDYEIAIGIYNQKKVAKNIHLLAEYDLKYKGVNNPSTDEDQLLKELVYKLMH